MTKPKGKKITAVPVSSPTRKQMVDIYLDTHTGRFSARFNGGSFDDITLEGLRQKLTDAVSVDFDCIWEPYLHCETESSHQNGAWAAMKFWFQLVIISEPLNGKRYVRDAWIDSDGTLVPADETHAHVFEQKGSLIPYTPERMEVVLNIYKAVRDTGFALHSKLIAASPEEATRWIDEQSTNRSATRSLRSVVDID